MSYSFQTFAFLEVLSSAKMNQIEVNIRDHLHGQNGVANAVPVAVIQPWVGVGSTPPTGWLFCDGAAVARATYSALFAAMVKSAAITVTVASPAVVTWTAHDLQNNDPVKFSTTGALPTGITAGTTYYVVNKGANTFNIAASPGAAAINTSGTQSGTHTGIHAPFGDGDGSTTFNVPDLKGRVAVGRDAGLGGSAANRITTGGSGINGDTPGTGGGADTVTLSTAQIPVHSHSISGSGTTSGFSSDHSHTGQNKSDTASSSDTGRLTNGGTPYAGGPFGWSTGGSSADHTHTWSFSGTSGNAGSGSAHLNVQPVLVVPAFIIKT